MADDTYTFKFQAQDDASEELEDARKSIELTEEDLERLEKQQKETSEAASVFSGVLAGELVAEGLRSAVDWTGQLIQGTAQMSEEWAQSTAEMQRNAAAAGMSAEEYQKLSYSFERMNLGAGEVTEVLGTLSERAVDATNGSKGLQEDFASLGISSRELAANMENPRQLLDLISKRLASTEDPTRRLKGAMSLLGDEAGKQLVGHLSQGGDALGEMGEQAEQMGITMDEQTRAKAHRLNEAIKDLRGETKGLKNIFMRELAPVLSDGTRQMQGFIRAMKDDGTVGTLAEDLAGLGQEISELANMGTQTGDVKGSRFSEAKKATGSAAQIGGGLAAAGAAGAMILMPEPVSTGTGLAMVAGALGLGGGTALKYSASDDQQTRIAGVTDPDASAETNLQAVKNRQKGLEATLDQVEEEQKTATGGELRGLANREEELEKQIAKTREVRSFWRKKAHEERMQLAREQNQAAKEAWEEFGGDMRDNPQDSLQSDENRKAFNQALGGKAAKSGEGSGSEATPGAAQTQEIVDLKSQASKIESKLVDASGQRKRNLEAQIALIEKKIELQKIERKQARDSSFGEQEAATARRKANTEYREELKDINSESQEQAAKEAERREKRREERQREKRRERERMARMRERQAMAEKEWQLIQAKGPKKKAQARYEKRILEIQQSQMTAAEKANQKQKAKNKLKRKEQQIAIRNTQETIGLAADPLSSAVGKAGSIATAGQQSQMERMNERASDAEGDEAEAIRARTEALREEIRVRRERYQAMSRGLDLMGTAGEKLAVVGEKGLESEKGFKAAVGGINQMGQAASQAGNAFIEGQKPRALFQGSLQTAMGIGKTALAAMGNPAAAAAAASHFASAGMFYTLAGKAGKKGKGGGGGGGSKAPGTAAVGGGVDLAKQRQAAATAFAEEMKKVQMQRAINISVDMRNSTNLEESIQTGRRIQDAVDRGMQDTRMAS